MYYHQMGDSELGKFKFKIKPFKTIARAVHVTKTSFQPKKILGAIGAAAGATATFGFGPMIAPKIFSANSKTMKSVGIGVTAIAAVAGAVIMGPAIAATLGPTLSSGAALAGKAVTGMSTFMSVFSKLQPKHQQQVADTITAQQVADVELGKAQIQDFIPGYQAPSVPSPSPLPLDVQTPAGFGPDIQPGKAGVAEAGMFGGMPGGSSPLALGLLVGIPLAIGLFSKSERN